MSDELRAAAERLVEVLRERHHGRMPDDVREAYDRVRVALAANPADDAEPVTGGWLESIGADPDEYGPMFPLPADTRPPIPFDRGVIHVRVDPRLDVPEAVIVDTGGGVTWLGFVPTRGDVRALLRALKVTPVAPVAAAFEPQVLTEAEAADLDRLREWGGA